jgi:KDO2-lipid IV(A) lauroyltransferase
VDFVVQALSNPGVDAMLARSRERAGVGTIPRGAGIRSVFQALRENRCVALVADQDARSGGVFVPFFGTLASTAVGPAELALRTGAPLIVGFATRQDDGRHVLELEPPLEVSEPRSPDAARRLTAAHTARLEARIRARPEPWFWLHRRWKTRPPATEAGS